MLKNCLSCLDDSRQPFGIYLRESNVCQACYNRKQLKQASSHFEAVFSRDSSKNRYDCIVIVQGTPEDFYVVKTLVEIGKFPLLFFVNNYFCNEIAWQNVHRLIELYDLEMRTFNPDIKMYKKLISFSFRKYEDIFFPHKMIKFFKAFELAQEVNVTLIISGEQQPEVTVGKFNKTDLVENTKWSFQQHELGGLSFDSFFDTGFDANPSDLKSIIPSKAYSRDVRWIYLSNYVEWDQWKQDVEMLSLGAKAEKNSGSFDTCYRAGNGAFYELQDILRHKKFGHFKLRDHLSREIRQSRITRTSAENLYTDYNIVRKFYVDEFFHWLGVSNSGVDWIKYNLLGDYSFSDVKLDDKFNWNNYFHTFFETEATPSERQHILMDKGI